MTDGDAEIKSVCDELTAAVLRLYNMEPCEFCDLTYLHHHDCLDRMNRVRVPTGDWWKL